MTARPMIAKAPPGWWHVRFYDGNGWRSIAHVESYTFAADLAERVALIFGEAQLEQEASSE